MRTEIEKTPKGLEARAIAGTYVVLLAMNCPKSYCKGLLGFGIQRKDQTNGEVIWLRGLKKFDLPGSTEGDDVSTRAHPVQKFHWGDYTAKPGRKYTYTIHAFKGAPGALTVFEKVELKVKTEVPESVGKNGHSGLASVTRGRDGKGINISHNKFMVHTSKAGKALAVWTGSTNFTDSGVYAQSNVGHSVADPDLADQYLQWHQEIFNAPETSAADSRKIAMRLTAVPAGAALTGTRLVLSPRSSVEAVDECAALVGSSKRMVCFTAPFAMHDHLEAALVAAPAQVFGMLNKDGVVGPELHKAPNTLLAAAGAVDEKSILEAWQGKLLRESMHHSGVFIHTKLILVDPLSDNPIVISGSANFSDNSCRMNDENQLFIAGETEVADVYLGEFMRIFDHYYFRDVVSKLPELRKKDPKAGFLKEDSSWADEYFGGSREALRLSFF